MKPGTGGVKPEAMPGSRPRRGFVPDAVFGVLMAAVVAADVRSGMAGGRTPGLLRCLERWILLASLLPSAASDWRDLTVWCLPTLAGAAGLAVVKACSGIYAVASAVGGAALTAAALLALRWLSRGGLAMGDVQVCALVGLGFGARRALQIFWLGNILALLALPVMRDFKDSKGRRVIPLVPWLYIACASTLLILPPISHGAD